MPIALPGDCSAEGLFAFIGASVRREARHKAYMSGIASRSVMRQKVGVSEAPGNPMADFNEFSEARDLDILLIFSRAM